MQSSSLANWDGSLTRTEEQKRTQKRNDAEDSSKVASGPNAQIYSTNGASISEVYGGHNNFSANGVVDLGENINRTTGSDASALLERAGHVKNLEERGLAFYAAGTSAVGSLVYSNDPKSSPEVPHVPEGSHKYTANGHQIVSGTTEIYTSIRAENTTHISGPTNQQLASDWAGTTSIDPLVFSNSSRSTPTASPPGKITFTPIATSPLHTYRSRNELSFTEGVATPSRAIKQLNVNVLPSLDVTETTLIYQAPKPPPQALKRIPFPSLDAIKAMSQSTADADGEGDEDDLFLVQNMLSCPSPHKTPTRSKPVRAASPMSESPLFTPPPPSIVPSVYDLFSPPPSPPPPKRKRRVVMSYILIPPFPDGKSKSSYMALPRPPKKKKAATVQVHQSLQDALSASINHNASTGTLPSRKKPRSEKPRPRPLHPPTPVEEKTKKRPRPEGDDKGKREKRRRVTIDLTLSDDEDDLDKSKQQPPSPPKQRVTHSRYHKNEGRTELFIRDFEPLSSTTIAFNTRFIRKEHSKDDDKQNPDIVQQRQRKTMPHKTNTAYSSVLCPLSRESSREHTLGTYSVGGTVSELSGQGNNLSQVLQEDQESSSVIFVNSGLPTPPLPSIATPKPPKPPRIDLVEMRKKIRNQQQVTERSGQKPKQSPPKGNTASIVTSPTRRKVEDSPQKRNDYELAVPSAKALGKKKATTPSPPPSPGISQGDVPSPHVLNSYLQDPLPHSSFIRPSAVIDGYLHDTTLMNLYQNSTHNPEFGEPNLTNSFSPARALRPHLHGTSEDILADLDYSMPNSTTGYEDSWSGSLAIDDTPQYQSDYIDPTLLGGQPQDLNYMDLEEGPFPESGEYHAAEDAGSTSSSLSSSSSSSPRRLKEHRPSTFSGLDGPQSDSDSDSDVILVKPAIRKRLSPSPISDELDVDTVPVKNVNAQSTSEYDSPSALSDSENSRPRVSRKRIVRKPARYQQPSSASSDSDLELEGPSRPQTTKQQSGTPFDPETYRAKPKSAPLKASRVVQDWPLIAQADYCHQCRNKTFLQKMICSVCLKKFCVRCLSIRYPDKTFDLSTSSDSCPFCELYCNCTLCCSKRGETYVSSARPPKASTRDTSHMGSRLPPAKPVRKPKVLLPSAPLPSMPPATVVAPATTKFWGTLYSLTGERIGRAYVDPNTSNSMIYAQSVAAKAAPPAPPSPRPLPPSQPVNKAKPKRKRTFIGRIQRSWGMKIKKTKLERHIKHAFVGKSRFLRYEKSSIPATNPNCDDWGDLSSLSSLESEDEPEVAATQFSSESLEDNDISRAIALSLAACAVEGTHDADVPPLQPQPSTIAGPLPS